MEPVRLDVQDQAVAVRHLLHARVLHGVGDLADRREDGVHRDDADRVARLLVLVRHAVADAALDGHLHLQGRAPGQRGDVQLGVEDLDAGGRRDVAGGDLGRALGLQVDRGGLLQLRADHQLLEVQDDVGDVLGHLGDRRELVQHAIDADRRDGGAGDGRQQGPAQRVADGVAESGLERLDGELRAVRRDHVLRDLRPGDDEHVCLLQRGISHSYPTSWCPGAAKRRRGVGACATRDDACAAGSRCAAPASHLGCPRPPGPPRPASGWRSHGPSPGP